MAEIVPGHVGSDEPQVMNILGEDALEITHSAFGSVGRLFTGEGLEVVWVKKDAEEIDPGWFSQPMVDLILVVQGRLMVEFETVGLSPRVLEPGEMLILPANQRCRAYRWPRQTGEATLFLAVYPLSPKHSIHEG